MKPERLFLILSVVGIFILLVLSNFEKPVLSGELSSIKMTKSSISIKLESFSEEIVIINKTKLPEKLERGMKIEVYGDKQKSLEVTTIFVDKLICLNC